MENLAPLLLILEPQMPRSNSPRAKKSEDKFAKANLLYPITELENKTQLS
jgi:hypothetical protein